MKNGLMLAPLIALFLSACGDSGPNRAPDTLPVEAADDVVVVGPINGFGSVVVNGIDFDTGSASVTLDDQPGVVSDLKIGMMVSVSGTLDSNTRFARAGEISFIDDAEGPISSIDRTANSFVVLGRTLFVDELTVFEDTSFEAYRLEMSSPKTDD